jgi:hypothetical protein
MDKEAYCSSLNCTAPGLLEAPSSKKDGAVMSNTTNKFSPEVPASELLPISWTVSGVI